MAHQYMHKIFHGPHKNPPVPPPTYLMHGPSNLDLKRFINLLYTASTLNTTINTASFAQKFAYPSNKHEIYGPELAL